MKIKLYLSKQGFDKKPENSAGIIKMINSYDLVDIEVEELYNKLVNGHFMHHECGYSPASTGSKYYTFKKQLLEQTQIMCVDLDYKIKETKKDKNGNEKEIIKDYKPNEMPDWNDEILGDLKYENQSGQTIDVTPTFWMESFSSRKTTDKKIVGNSIHLFYVFYESIYNKEDFEKVSISIIYSLYRALQTKGYEIPLEKEKCPFDPVSTDMFQGLWGSYNKNHGYNGNLYFADDWKNSYNQELKTIIFQKSIEESTELTEEDIKRTISAYNTVKSIDDIDISKSQYIKYKEYFGHEEGFHIMSVLKCEYAKIEGKEEVNNKQSLCYQVCKKLLLGNCNDFFDNDEHKFYHEYKRCKMYYKKGSNEAAYMSHVIKLIGDTGAIPLIEYKELTNTKGNIIRLEKNEYLSDKKEEIMNMMVYDDKTINFIIAEPGLGKTVFAKSLSGNVLIIELFRSIIKSEEKFSSDDFSKFLEDKYIKSESITRLNVCTANKFVSWCQSGDCSMFDIMGSSNECLFDNIILDESHLLCLSNFRYDKMGETVECIKKLKLVYPNVNIILMTGTPFGEDVIFDNLNTIRIDAEPRYARKFHMIQTSSIVGYIQELVKDSLKNGLRIFMPVDSENWFDTFIKSCVDEGIITKNKCYYFNQPKTNEDTEVYILNTKLIGDIQILGVSSYMSVGIDLEDWKTEFITIIPSGASVSGNFSGIETVQFANRHRKQNLEVYYVVSKNDNNMIKPTLSMSCRALLNIKNDLLKTLYRTNPIIIKIPQYLVKDKSEHLELNEDMYNVFVYYKDMKPIISHPSMIYEYMEKKNWQCTLETIDNVHRGLKIKEHRDIEKEEGVGEFMKLVDEWDAGNFPKINVDDNIQKEFNLIKHIHKYSLFDLDSIDVGFSNYYAKNVLFNKFLNLREYLTCLGTYNLIKDAYDNNKINMSFIDRTLLAIKITNNYKKKGLWKEISDKLGEFYDKYSTIENGVHKDNKSQFESERDNVIQGIWDKLGSQIEDDTLNRAFNSNYNNVTENLIDDFMEGIRLVNTMYLTKKTGRVNINKKKVTITIYKWDDKALSRYEIRKDKVNKI